MITNLTTMSAPRNMFIMDKSCGLFAAIVASNVRCGTALGATCDQAETLDAKKAEAPMKRKDALGFMLPPKFE